MWGGSYSKLVISVVVRWSSVTHNLPPSWCPGWANWRSYLCHLNLRKETVSCYKLLNVLTSWVPEFLSIHIYTLMTWWYIYYGSHWKNIWINYFRSIVINGGCPQRSAYKCRGRIGCFSTIIVLNVICIFNSSGHMYTALSRPAGYKTYQAQVWVVFPGLPPASSDWLNFKLRLRHIHI